MCGITGAIEIKSKASLDFTSDGKLYKYISKRGPDFYNYKSFEINEWKLTLAHSRLSIIDLSDSSNQPMISESGNFVISFNGEIYNYNELKLELLSKGCHFKTDGDTEVLLKSWEFWGPGCLHKLNGMFAFAVYDTVKSELFLVRDRFGVKPLLFGFNSNNEFIFSSSISAIASQIDGEIDLDYCSNGIRYGFFEGYKNLTPFKKVKYVLPGSYINIKLDSNTIAVNENIWYSLDEEVEKTTLKYSHFSDVELLEYGKSLIENSVMLRLRSDVPLAVSLSGGVDSSSIAALARNEVPNLTGFCYGSPSSIKSEGPMVNKFVTDKKINVVYIHPEYSYSELGDLLDRTSESQEAPFCGLSILAQHEVYKSVNLHGFKVLLGGQGGDEIFAGYRKFYLVALKNSWNTKNTTEFISFMFSFAILLLNGVGNYRTYWQQRNRFLKSTGKEFSIISNLPINKIDLIGNLSLKKRQILDIQNFSIPSLLRYEDRNSMNYSIESRLPFMDYRLVEFAISLHDRMKIHKGYGKWALREMMRPDVPSYLLNNNVKRGFDVTQDWISKGVGDRLRSNLFDSKSILQNYISDFKLLENKLSIENLKNNTNLLYEAMLLNFLVKPLKEPGN